LLVAERSRSHAGAGAGRRGDPARPRCAAPGLQGQDLGPSHDRQFLPGFKESQCALDGAEGAAVVRAHAVLFDGLCVLTRAITFFSLPALAAGAARELLPPPVRRGPLPPLSGAPPAG